MAPLGFPRANLLVQFDIREDGVDAPGFGEHGAEGEREAGHEGPDPSRANDGQGGFPREVRVQSQEDHARVGEQTADDDEIV